MTATRPNPLTTSRSLALMIAAACALPATGPALGQAGGLPALSNPLGSPEPRAAAPATGTPARPPSPRPASFREIKWDDLMPRDWDPSREFKGLDLGFLSDSDPRAIAALKKLREVWDSAPVNNRMHEVAVRLPGYVVPLEENKAGMTEFLLVPYYGACIHSPPPPANQIIHVMPQTPARGLKSMDTVWVSGILRTLRTDSYMGVSGYRMESFVVEPYVEKR